MTHPAVKTIRAILNRKALDEIAGEPDTAVRTALVDALRHELAQVAGFPHAQSPEWFAQRADDEGLIQ